MAATPEQLEFVRAEAAIRAAIEGQLTAAIAELARSGVDPRQIRDAVFELTAALVREYGQAAAGFAADWYNDMRLTAGIPAGFVAVGYVQDFDEQIEATVRRAVGGLFGDSPDPDGFATAVASRAAQWAVDGGRNTIIENTYRDPRARGWQRVPHGPTCDFCLLLVGRGGVYRQRTALFKAHPGCDCGAVPSWDPDAAEVPTIAYQASSRMQALRDRAAAGDRRAQRILEGYRVRIRAYIADHQDEFAALRREFDVTPL